MRALLARREAELAAGAEPVGWKVGFNFPQLWPQLGIDAPVAGSLTSATVLEPGAPIRLDGWTRPLLEPEVAIHVAEEGGVAALAPAVELIDADLPFENLEAILARNIFHRGVLLGPADPARTTLEGFHCRVTKNGQQVAVAEESEDPAATLAHVAGFLSAHGARLRPGERVIAGSLTPPVPVAPGDEVRVEIAPLGAVELTFAG